MSHRANTAALYASVCLALTLPQAASAQETLTVAGYGGSFERLMRETIIPSFEAAHGARVEYVAGQSTATLAKLQAQRAAQEIDVAIVDDGPMYQAVDFGFCAAIEDSPELEAVVPVARLADSAVAFGIGVTGPVYNTEIFEAENLPVPTSWADLGNDVYKGRIALLGAGSTTGLHGLIMVARAEGGGEADIDPGFAAYSEKIRPNLVTFAPSAPKLEELLQSGEIAMTVVSRSRALALQKQGLPIAVAEPKEGAVALMVTMCPVVDSDVPDLAQAFVRHMLSPDAQVALAGAGYTPVNGEVELSEELLATVPARTDELDKLARIDWPTVNKERGAWTQRWNREVER